MDWETFIANETKQLYYQKLSSKINDERSKLIDVLNIYPDQEDIFNAFKQCSYKNTKVVIIGQDPYHGQDQAHGLSFSVKTQKIPPSLRNIFKELENDLSYKRLSPNLTDWAKQGVLLLNSVLTVTEGKPNSHKGWGWETFTDNVIQEINNNKNGIVFILWGKEAQKKGAKIDENKHIIIKSNHPSPLSANKGGFFGTKPFSKCNSYLQIPIIW